PSLDGPSVFVARHELRSLAGAAGRPTSPQRGDHHRAGHLRIRSADAPVAVAAGGKGMPGALREHGQQPLADLDQAREQDDREQLDQRLEGASAGLAGETNVTLAELRQPQRHLSLIATGAGHEDEALLPEARDEAAHGWSSNVQDPRQVAGPNSRE